MARAFGVCVILSDHICEALLTFLLNVMTPNLPDCQKSVKRRIEGEALAQRLLPLGPASCSEMGLWEAQILSIRLTLTFAIFKFHPLTWFYGKRKFSFLLHCDLSV